MEDRITDLDCGAITVYNRQFDVFGYKDDTWYQDVKKKGVWNEFNLRHLAELVSPSDICLDLGANVGMMTLALSTLAPKGHVYAFEASPGTAAALDKTLRTNGLGNASAYNAVIGRSSEKVKFFDMPDVRSSGFYVNDNSSRTMTSVWQDTSKMLSVETKSVDQIVEELDISQVNFLKIDVEGAELDVLAGAQETLKKFRPIVVMEFNSYAFVHLREIIPRHALGQILGIFDEVYYYENRVGNLVRIKNTEKEIEQFLHKNMLNGYVDDLLCVFSGTRLVRSFCNKLPQNDLNRRIDDLSKENDELRRAVAGLQKDNDGLKRSTSWRITAPLRSAKRIASLPWNSTR